MINQLSAEFAAPRSDLDQVIRAANHRLFVLDHQKSVSFVAQAAEHADQPVNISRMKSDTRFIEHKKGVDQGGAQASRQIHSLHFTAREGARRTVQREISEPDIDQIVEPGNDLRSDNFRRAIFFGDTKFGQTVCQSIDRHLLEIRERQSLLANDDPKIQRFRFEPRAMTLAGKGCKRGNGSEKRARAFCRRAIPSSQKTRGSRTIRRFPKPPLRSDLDEDRR